MRLWNLSEKNLIAIFIGHACRVRAVAITRENRNIVSTSDDMTLRIWSVKRKINKAVFKAAGYIWKLVITRSDRYIVSCTSTTVNIWDLKKQREIATLEGHTDNIVSLAVTVNSKYIISGSLDNTVRVWRAKYQCNYFRR